MSSEFSSNLGTKRYAVVTGSNKGIKFEACRQFASRGVTVILTARDSKKGLEALERLRSHGLSDYARFHQLDVTDSKSVVVLADFVKAKFGKLDILVNNAALLGVHFDSEALKAQAAGVAEVDPIIFMGITSQTYEMAEECIDANFYGMKRMVEAFLPLLQASDSPRIVNVSSLAGQLQYINNEWAEGILANIDDLTEVKLDAVIKEFLLDLKADTYAAKGWSVCLPAYSVSKVTMNAYTRSLAKKYTNISINCICPGFIRADMTQHVGNFPVEEGGAIPVWVALRSSGITGLFFSRYELVSF